MKVNYATLYQGHELTNVKIHKYFLGCTCCTNMMLWNLSTRRGATKTHPSLLPLRFLEQTQCKIFYLKLLESLRESKIDIWGHLKRMTFTGTSQLTTNWLWPKTISWWVFSPWSTNQVNKGLIQSKILESEHEKWKVKVWKPWGTGPARSYSLLGSLSGWPRPRHDWKSYIQTCELERFWKQ